MCHEIKVLAGALKIAEKTAMHLEAVGDGKLRVNCEGWDDPKVILGDEALEVVGIGKQLYIFRRNRPLGYIDDNPEGLKEAGY